MGDKTGFIKYKRKLPGMESVETRIRHFKSFIEDADVNLQKEQASRCMDCGVPFCHSGCPLGNLIPDFNEAVYRENWKKAYELLSATNNFPEFTGRICPAPCESSCVLSINRDPVTIELIEKSISDHAFRNGWANQPIEIIRTDKQVAIVGSGPAGLAAADQLNRAGHLVTVYEKQDRPGGLLRYGIPDFKLEKGIVDRRIELMKEQGIRFELNCEIGKDKSTGHLLKEYDAIVLCGGSSVPRDLQIEGREYKNIEFAMRFLEQSNRRVAGDKINPKDSIQVEGKKVVVIGGGDTGSDCIGTSNRLGASSITQIALMGEPPLTRTPNNPWPEWPMTMKTSSSHEEGCGREWALWTKRFLSEDGVSVSGIEVVSVKWDMKASGEKEMIEIPNTSRIIPCDLVFLAIGYIKPGYDGLLEGVDIKIDEKNLIETSYYQTSTDKIFAAGDMRRGQSLVVWAISEGREAARRVDQFLLKKNSVLDTKEQSVMSI